MINLYPSEKFSITTNLNRAEIVEKLEFNVILNHYSSFIKPYNTKYPEKLYDGIVHSSGFKISKAKIYGDVGSWYPELNGRIADNLIEVELKFPTLGSIIMLVFLIFGIFGLIFSTYYAVTDDKFDSLITYFPLIPIFVYVVSYNGFKKEIGKTKIQLNRLFNSE